MAMAQNSRALVTAKDSGCCSRWSKGIKDAQANHHMSDVEGERELAGVDQGL